MSFLRKYKAVLFDLDGTLLDTSEGILASVRYVVEKEGLKPFNEEESDKFIGPPIQNSLKKEYDLTAGEAARLAAIFRKRYSTVDLCKAAVYPGVIEMLTQLRKLGCKIGVATYKRMDYASDILDKFDILGLCDCVEGSDFEGLLTKRDIIENCIRNLNCPKNEVLMVGDTENDLTGAENAGVDFLAVTFGFGFKDKSKLNCYAENCNDITEYIKNSEE